MSQLNFLFYKKTFLQLIGLVSIVGLLSCTFQPLNNKKATLNHQHSPLTEPGFGIKSLVARPEEEPTTLFIAASDNKPVTISTIRDIPKNHGIDLQSFTMRAGSITPTIKKGLSAEEVKTIRNSLLKEGRQFLKEIYLLSKQAIRTEFLSKKEALQNDKKSLDKNKYTKPLTKEIRDQIDALEKQHHQDQKELRAAYKQDWNELETNIKTIFHKPNKGFGIKSTDSNISSQSLSALTKTIIEVSKKIIEVSQAYEELRKSMDITIEDYLNRSFAKNITFMSETANDNRDIYNDTELYSLIGGIDPEKAHLYVPQTEVSDSGLPNKVEKSQVVVDQTLQALSNLNTPKVSKDFEISDILTALKINIPQQLREYQGTYCHTLDADKTKCPPAATVNINLNINAAGSSLPTTFFSSEIRQQLEGSQKFLLTLQLFGTAHGSQTLSGWLKSQVQFYSHVLSIPDYQKIINDIDTLNQKYSLDEGQLLVSLESPDMCEIPNDGISRQRIYTNVNLGDMFRFENASNTPDPLDGDFSMKAINQDNLLVDGTYKLALKIKPKPIYDPKTNTTGSAIPRSLCLKFEGGFCYLAEQDIQFIPSTRVFPPTSSPTPPPLVVNPNLSVERGFVIDPIEQAIVAPNEIHPLRTHISYYVRRKGSNMMKIEIKPAGFQANDPLCLPIWDIQCVDHNKSLIEINHQKLPTGVYSVLASYSNPQKIKELDDAKDERRFVALHLKYSTFAYATEKAHTVNAYGIPFNDPDLYKNFTLLKISNSGRYHNFELVEPDPGLKPINTLPYFGEEIGPKLVSEALTKIKNNGLYFEGGFKNGVQNTLVELASPHSEGMNLDYDSFGRIQFNSNNPKKYLQIGFVAELSNNLTKNNNFLTPGNQYQPVSVEIVDVNGTVVASFPKNVKLGARTYVSFFWDGSIDDDDSVTDGFANYKSGLYSVRLSLPDDGYQKLIIRPNQTGALNPEDASGKPFYPKTDLTFPTLSNDSTQALVEIQNNSSNVDLDLSQPIIWKYLEEADREFGDVSLKLAEYSQRNAIGGLVSPLYLGTYGPLNFGLAQTLPEGSLLVSLSEKERLELDLRKLSNINVTIEDGLDQLQLFRRAGTIDSVEAKELRRKIVLDLFQKKDLLKIISDKPWLLEEIEIDILKASMSVHLRLWALISPLLVSGNNLEPEHKNIHNSLKALQYLVFERLYVRAARSENTCKFVISGKNSAQKTAVKQYLSRLTDVMLERVQKLYANEMDYFLNDPGNAILLSTTKTNVLQAFAEMYMAETAMIEVCDKCISETRRSELINQRLTEAIPNADEDDYNAEKFTIKRAARQVTQEELNCRICDSGSDTTLDTVKIKNMDLTLAFREALLTQTSLVDEQNVNVGISNSRLAPASTGFTWVHDNGVPKTLVVGVSGAPPFGPGNVYPPLNYIKYKNIIIERIRKRIPDLKEKEILIAEESCRFGVSSVYNSIKGSICQPSSEGPGRGDTNGGDIKGTVQHDAEIKILETIINHTSTNMIPELNINLFADRVNCQFCQEVFFRANRVEKLQYEDGQIVNGIKATRTKIRSVTAQGFPLHLGEQLDQQRLAPTRTFIRELLNSNSNHQKQICQPFRR